MTVLFISHSKDDEETALAVCSAVEARGARCWIAQRDIQLGDRWSSAIIDAINRCDAVIVIFSSSANSSNHVQREVEHAVNGNKRIIPFRLAEILPTGSLAYFMGGLHWVDAFRSNFETAVEHLTLAVLGEAIRIRSELRSEDIDPSAARKIVEKARELIERESAEASQADRQHYLCYLSKGKIDNLLASNQWEQFRGSPTRLPVDLNQMIIGSSPARFQKTDVERLAYVLRQLERAVRPFDWSYAQTIATDGLDVFWARLKFTLNYEEPNPIVVLVAVNGNQELLLHCSVSNFSSASSNGPWFSNSMANAIMTSRAKLTFEGVFFAIGAYDDAIVGSPLYLRMPINPGFRL
jgi:hypothetical protein